MRMGRTKYWTRQRILEELAEAAPLTRSQLWRERPDLAAAINRAGLTEELMPPSRKGIKND